MLWGMWWRLNLQRSGRGQPPHGSVKSRRFSEQSSPLKVALADEKTGRKDMILGIHHFSIIASSEESIGFYKKLGFREEQRIERGYDTVVLMSGYGVGLEIFIDPKHPGRTSPEPLGLRMLALRVDDVEKTLEELGLEKAEINTDWFGNRYCLITDPDGNLVQMCE